MNIFVLDSDPVQAARYLADKHVPKMLLESCQLLSTAHHHYNTPQAESLYKKAHYNHPATIWCRESSSNYLWLLKHTFGINEEFEARRGKKHKSASLLPLLSIIPWGIPDKGLTPFAQCMPEKYKVEGDAVAAYRKYYLNEKRKFATWTWPNTSPPTWWLSGTKDEQQSAR